MQTEHQSSMSYLGLPLDLFLNVLDQLVGFPDGRHTIFDPSSHVTRTLRALTLTSRTTYIFASRYLYRHCLYLGDCVSYTCIRRTLGISLGTHPQSLASGQAGRNDELWHDAKAPRYIASVFISPTEPKSTNPSKAQSTYMVRLPHIIDLFSIIGGTLKRLILDMRPFYSPPSDGENQRFSQSEMNVLSGMPNLEELVASYDVPDYFRLPPPNLKKLAITTQDLHDIALRFCFSVSMLQTLVILRPVDLNAADIDGLFTAYIGQSLDIVLVDVNSNHRTPENTRNWTDSDKVRIWEVDVPTSFYGDDDNLILCDSWIWAHATKGTLWSQANRKMVSWSDIQRRLVGPVHYFLDDH